MARTDEEGMQQRGISTPAPIPRAAADGHTSSSGESEPMYRRLRRRAGNTTAAHNEPKPPLQLRRSTAGSRGKAGKRRAVVRRPRGPPNQIAATSATRVDPVEDELLLDCALAMRPHAHADSSQRARIWQEIADELKLVNGTRLTRYTANGLMMRLGYLLKVLHNPLHREHGALQGTLRDKLVHYSESLPPRRPRQAAYASTQNISHDDRRVAAAESDDGSGSGNESEATTLDMVGASGGYAFQRDRNVADSRAATHPQAPHGRDADSTRSASPSRGSPDQVPLPAIAGVAESASSTAMLMALMQQAERGWREQHDESMLLLHQSGMIHQRCLEQHQARMADQREWRKQCLSLFAERPPTDSARHEEDPSDSDECDSSDECGEKRGCRKAC